MQNYKNSVIIVICHYTLFSVHIRRTDKISSFHQLEEYMYYVEDYYKLQELNGEVNYKKIYLATDDPTLFKEAYDKQVKIVFYFYIII